MAKINSSNTWSSKTKTYMISMIISMISPTTSWRGQKKPKTMLDYDPIISIKSLSLRLFLLPLLRLLLGRLPLPFPLLFFVCHLPLVLALQVDLREIECKSDDEYKHEDGDDDGIHSCI